MKRVVIACGIALIAGSAFAGTVSFTGALNPDVTQDTIKSTICVSGWTAKVRPPASYTNKLKLQQMKAMNLPGKPSDYEEDHFIDLGAGGNPTDPNNLYPQTWPEAHKKDRLEVYIQRSICKGTITLAEGQNMILSGWKQSYQKVFGTIP